MIDLSIIIPSIRIERWPALLESIKKACTNYSYEVIFVGPHAHNCINGTSVNQNIKFIRDLGHPNRCQHIGSLIAEGKYIHFGSDDCLYTADSIDAAVDLLNDQAEVVTANYKEGGNGQSNLSILACYGNNHKNEIKDDWVILNVPFMQTSMYQTIGGFDCRYQTTCWGHVDLAARVQTQGIRLHVLDTPVLECTHMPGTTGDHAPIHHAFYEDQIIFMSKSFSDTVTIPNTSWTRNSKPVWEKRWT